MASTTSRKIQVKFDGDTSGLAVAAAEGEAIVKHFGEKSGDNVGRGFTGGLKKWLTGGASDLEDAGKQGGTVFGSGFAGMLKTPILGPVLLGVLAATILTILPVIGTLLAGGLVLAFGGALAGLGLVFAAKSPAIVAKFSKLKDDIGGQLKLISKPFESTLSHIADVARRVFGSFTKPLGDAFKEIAPAMSTFSDNLGTAIQQLAPVIKPVSDAFVAMMKSLGPALPGIVSGIADGIIAIADSIAKHPDTFTHLIEFFGKAVEWSLKFIGALSNVANWFDAHPSITAGLVGGLRNLFSPIATVIDLFKNAKKAWDKVKALFEKVHIAKLAGDAGKFFSTIGGAIGKAAKWAASKFTSALSAATGGVTSALSSAYGSARGWAKSAWKATLGAFNKVGEVLAKVEQLGRNWAGKVFNATFGAIGKGIGNLIPHAMGGPVTAGQAYLVGEKGPEMFVPSGSGSITPNNKLGGGDTYVYVTIDGQQLQGRIDKTVRSNNRNLKRTVKAA